MPERAILLVTILVGAIGWLFTHLVERVANAPTIEFSIKTETDGKHKKLLVELNNITRSQAFQEVRLLLTAPSNGVIRDVLVRPTEPSSEGNKEPHVYGRSADVYLQDFMPGARVLVTATYDGGDRPAVRASAVGTAARFQKSDWETYFVRHEVVILIVLAGVVLISVIFILVRTKGTAPTTQPSGSQ